MRDFVLCAFNNTYHYVARVLAKYNNETFARRIWGEDDDGDTWQYMYFLTKPLPVDVHLSEYEGYLMGAYRGFTRISDAYLSAIDRDYERPELLVRELVGYEGEGVLPPELSLGQSRSRRIAKDSLEVDDVAHGKVEKEVVPDSEGRKQIREHVTYERSRKNREQAIRLHGTTCAVCNFNFDDFYGPEYADGYIQIHHVKPLSEHEGAVDPKTDLVPLCANCHVMAHRRKGTVTSVEDLRALIDKALS